jgi:hypothetical protein
MVGLFIFFQVFFPIYADDDIGVLETGVTESTVPVDLFNDIAVRFFVGIDTGSYAGGDSVCHRVMLLKPVICRLRSTMLV